MFDRLLFENWKSDPNNSRKPNATKLKELEINCKRIWNHYEFDLYIKIMHCLYTHFEILHTKSHQKHFDIISIIVIELITQISKKTKSSNAIIQSALQGTCHVPFISISVLLNGAIFIHIIVISTSILLFLKILARYIIK